MRKGSCVVLAGLLAAATFAGCAPLRGPVTGHVFDSKSRTIRPIHGVPGSSLLGPAVELPLALKHVEIAPGSRFGLAVSEGNEEGVYLISDLEQTSPRVKPLNVPAPDHIQFSANGASAVLWSSRSDRLHIVAGLPDQPIRLREISVANLPGAITAAAVTSDGSSVLIGVSEPERKGGVYRFLANDAAEGTASELLLETHRVSAISFLPGEQDVVIADTGSAEILRIGGIATGRETVLLASAADGVDNPSALGQTVDGRRLLIVDSGSRFVLVADLSGREPIHTIPTPVVPARCDRMTSESVFRLNDGEQGPLYLLDLENEPGVYFVPGQ